MIAHRNAVKPTKDERERITRMLLFGCICCAEFSIYRHAECHHIVEGNKRLGHWYTLPLCKGHHRGEWIMGENYGIRVALSDGSKRFAEAFGTERELWKRMQCKLLLPYVWPSSKILPRRAV